MGRSTWGYQWKVQRFYVNVCCCVTKILMLEYLLNWRYFDKAWFVMNFVVTDITCIGIDKKVQLYWTHVDLCLQIKFSFTLNSIYVFIIAHFNNKQTADWVGKLTSNLRKSCIWKNFLHCFNWQLTFAEKKCVSFIIPDLWLLHCRQRDLQHAMLNMGQTEHALNELLAWLDRTDQTLDENSPVYGDRKLIEIEMAKHKVSSEFSDLSINSWLKCAR